MSSRAIRGLYLRRRRLGRGRLRTGVSHDQEGSCLRGQASDVATVTPPRGPLDRRDAVLVIVGATDPTVLTGLCESARVLLADADTTLLVCDVHAIEEPDLSTVDALARLALVARHLGGNVLLLDASPELRDLLHLAGLADVVPCVAVSPRVAGIGRTAGTAARCRGRR